MNYLAQLLRPHCPLPHLERSGLSLLLSEDGKMRLLSHCCSCPCNIVPNCSTSCLLNLQTLTSDSPPSNSTSTSVRGGQGGAVPAKALLFLHQPLSPSLSFPSPSRRLHDVVTTVNNLMPRFMTATDYLRDLQATPVRLAGVANSFISVTA